MKKVLSIIGSVFFLFSCNSGPSDEAKKSNAQILESSINDFSRNVDEYCSCVAEKGIEPCNSLHAQLMDARSYAESHVNSSVENGFIDKKEDVDNARNRIKELFDKKAQCAQEAMNKQ